MNPDELAAKKTELIISDKKRFLKRKKVRLMVYCSAALSFAVFLILAIFNHFEIIFFGSTVDYIVFAVLSSSGIYGAYEYWRLKRIRMIDERIPDFLRDLAESKKAGMTFTKAISLTSKGNYGLLTDEIRRIAQQISWGTPVSEALELFAKRVNTPLARRVVSLINEASKSGGNVSDILLAASKEAKEIKEVSDERKISMLSYVIVVYIGSFVFLAVVAIICSTFLPNMIGATEATSSTAKTGMPVAGGGTSVDEIMMIFFYAALIQGFGSGIVAGVFEQGNLPAGLKHSFIIVIVTWIIFKIIIGI